MKKISLVILDDHDLIIEAIKSLIDQAPNLEYRGGFTTLNELNNFLDTKAHPDILILDIQLKNNEDGIEICKHLTHKFPELKIIMLSSITQSAIVTDSFKKGAKGFLPKNINLQELAEACDTVMNEKNYIHKDISLNQNIKGSKFDYIPKITRREKEVLKLVMEELTSAEIAKRLFISLHTVENHRASLFSKTGSKNIVGLIKYTIEKGLLED